MRATPYAFFPQLSYNQVHVDFPTVYSPQLYISDTLGIPMLRGVQIISDSLVLTKSPPPF